MLDDDESHWLREYLKTTRNLCDVALIVLEQGKDELMPIVLELMHVETQGLIDDYCVEDDNS